MKTNCRSLDNGFDGPTSLIFLLLLFLVSGERGTSYVDWAQVSRLYPKTDYLFLNEKHWDDSIQKINVLGLNFP
jgi:hypothetical protein